MVPYDFDDSLKARLQQNVADFVLADADHSALRPAAVAMIVTPHPHTGEATFLITLRASKLRRHSGQYALPGGRLDEGETLQQTALRETKEELGLTLSEADVLGRLDDMPTRSGFVIAPYVLWDSRQSNLRPEHREVERVFHIPLSDLDSPKIPTFESDEALETPAMCAPLATLGHQIYAPTAGILYQFQEVAIYGRPTRVAHFEQPAFAWK